MPNSPLFQMMSQAVSDGVFPGAVLLCAKNERILFHESFGQTNIFQKKVMEKNCIFDLASLTKPLATALAIERLTIQYPELLQHRIGDILEEFDSTDKADITVDLLLRHTSGYPAHKPYFQKTAVAGKQAESVLTDLLCNQRLENPVGAKQVYSDLGYMVLRKIIEKLSGHCLNQFVMQKIYQPMGINRLFFIPRKNKEILLGKYQDLIVPTQQCDWRNKLLVGEVDDENAWALGGVDGHAGLFGDALSVYRLCREIMVSLAGKANSFFDHHVVSIMTAKKGGFEKVAGFDTPSGSNSSSGSNFSSASIGHLGFTGTSFWMDPKTALIVVLLTNRIHPTRANESIRKFRPKIHDLITEQLL